MTDFEISAMDAIKQVYKTGLYLVNSKVFPEIVINGCLFHMAQAIFRKIQQLPNLLALFKNNTIARIKLKSLISLAFVPTDNVYEYFCLLFYQFELNPDIEG